MLFHLWFLVAMSMVMPTISLLPVLIYPSKRTESTETSITKFRSIPSTSFQDLSYCLWVKVNHLLGAAILHYDVPDRGGLGLTLQEEYGFVKLKTVDLLFDYHSPHIPGRWRHFCVVYDSGIEGVTVYMDGIVTFEKLGVTALVDTQFHPDLLQHVSVGKGGDRFSQQFNGEFSKLMVWRRVLGREEVQREWECKEVDTEGLVLDWLTVDMERGDTVMMAVREVNCPSELIDDSEELVGFGQRVKFEDAATTCLALGGRQEVPGREEEVLAIRDKFRNFKEDCNNKFWVPIRQDRGR